MEIKLRVFDKGHVVAKLRSIAQLVPEAARKQMHRAAGHIVKDAKLFVPEDTSALMESIRIVRTTGTHGRLQLDVIAGGKTVRRHGQNLVDLDEYAAAVHEDYENAILKGGPPGKNTQAKMARNPTVKIGSKFLTRAAEGQEERLRKVLAEVITDVIRRVKA